MADDDPSGSNKIRGSLENTWWGRSLVWSHRGQVRSTVLSHVHVIKSQDERRLPVEGGRGAPCRTYQYARWDDARTWACWYRWEDAQCQRI